MNLEAYLKKNGLRKVYLPENQPRDKLCEGCKYCANGRCRVSSKDTSVPECCDIGGEFWFVDDKGE